MGIERNNKVVIVGGGVSTAHVAKKLQSHAHLTILDPKDYAEIKWASQRSMVEPPFAVKAVIGNSDYFKIGKLVPSHVVNITDTHVSTFDGGKVPYNYLVIASAPDDDYPKTRDDMLQYYKAEHDKIISASSVLIVGGGQGGVQLAGEIAVDYPEKKVTLVHMGERLLERFDEEASKTAHNWLVSKKVEVLMEQSVDLNAISEGGKTTYRTSEGESIVADYHFLCIEKPFPGAWFHETLLEDSVDSQGRLMVDEKLRVKGHKNIFAVGDITDIPKIPQGYFALEHSRAVAKNIRLLISGGDESNLATYKPCKGKPTAFVSLGRKEGIAQFPFMTISGSVPGIMSGDLFVGKTRSKMGVASGKKGAKGNESPFRSSELLKCVGPAALVFSKFFD